MLLAASVQFPLHHLLSFGSLILLRLLSGSVPSRGKPFCSRPLAKSGVCSQTYCIWPRGHPLTQLKACRVVDIDMKLDPSKGGERDVSRTGSLQNHYSEVNPITNHPQLIGVNYWVCFFPTWKGCCHWSRDPRSPWNARSEARAPLAKQPNEPKRKVHGKASAKTEPRRSIALIYHKWTQNLQLWAKPQNKLQTFSPF